MPDEDDDMQLPTVEQLARAAELMGHCAAPFHNSIGTPFVCNRPKYHPGEHISLHWNWNCLPVISFFDGLLAHRWGDNGDGEGIREADMCNFIMRERGDAT